jgi:hypothetical protein
MSRALLIVSLLLLGASCGPNSTGRQSSGGGDGSIPGTGGGSAGSGGGTASGMETCDNQVDDDGDAKTDCGDPDCFAFAGCCLDLCSEGTSICDVSGVRSCELSAQTGCRAFGAPAPCGGGLVCSGGACLATCSDQCTAGAKQCSSSGSVVECKALATGCTDWVVEKTCPQGQACSGGACLAATACMDQCTSGATRCTTGGQVQTCVRLASGCTDWSFPAMCSGMMTCALPATSCAAPPACTMGAVRCAAASPAVETCDATGRWVATQSCPQACAMGQCTASASCTAGAVRCNGKNVEVCNASGSAWLYREACVVGCSLGQCTDPCTGGARRCNGDTVETCTDGGTSWAVAPLPDAGAPQCANGCYQGSCMDADLVIDGVTRTLEGDLAFRNSVVIKNGGQLKVGPSGQLSIKAKTISVMDSASQVNANGVGNTPASGTYITVYSYCYGGYTCCNGAYSRSTTVTCIGGQTTNCSVGNPCSGVPSPSFSLRTDDLSVAEGLQYVSGNPGGGLVRFVAERIEVKGQITSNGTGSGTGGSILLAADTITGNGALQATGNSNGYVKLVRGSTDSFTGSVTGTTVRSVMPPLDVVSGSHPVQGTWYNDGLGDLFLAWTKPFPTANGYYYRVSDSIGTLPSQSAGNGTFLQAEGLRVPADQLEQGTNYFHIVSVDSSFNVGTVKSTFSVNVNTEPPAIESASHPNERTWYQNAALFFSWTHPQDDANFTGSYYVFDKYADTVPAAVPQNFTTNKQVLLANTPNGIWVFHLVNRDTRGAITKEAAHYVVYVGTAPAKENISGSVFDASNNSQPLSGVTISVNRGLFTQTSTSAGTYTFNGQLFVGQWEVTASKPGYLPQTKMVTLTAGSPLNENFTLTRKP